jgi:23S rRNA pseudouridine1911/1915/1917 synthase
MNLQAPVVLYEDNHLLAVSKPAGMPVQGDKTGDLHLLQWAEAWLRNKHQKPGAAFVGLIHRIDRPVSGLVVLAKTSKALSRMNEIFRNRQVQKEYRAITTRSLPEHIGKLENYMAKDSVKNRAIVFRTAREGAKLAMLEYRLIAQKDDAYLYAIWPESGRFHQIRAQFAANRAPLAGDLKYGYPNPNSDKSICLHAYALRFTHPVSKEPLELLAPLPQSGKWQLFGQ